MSVGARISCVCQIFSCRYISIRIVGTLSDMSSDLLAVILLHLFFVVVRVAVGYFLWLRLMLLILLLFRATLVYLIQDANLIS
jgi:hypothetical protein